MIYGARRLGIYRAGGHQGRLLEKVMCELMLKGEIVMTTNRKKKKAVVTLYPAVNIKRRSYSAPKQESCEEIALSPEHWWIRPAPQGIWKEKILPGISEGRTEGRKSGRETGCCFVHVIWQVSVSVQAQRQHVTCQNNMSGQCDSAEPHSSRIPRVVCAAAAQNRTPRAAQTAAKLTFALDTRQEETRPSQDSRAASHRKLSVLNRLHRRLWRMGLE